MKSKSEGSEEGSLVESFVELVAYDVEQVDYTG